MNDEIINSIEEMANSDELPPFDVEVNTDAETLNEEEVTAKESENIEDTDNILNTPDEISALKTEIDLLKTELEEKKNAFEKISRDIGEFSELYPTKSINTIPDSVWESVKSGIPLAAAYALYEKKTAVRIDTASRINSKNSELSTGAVGRNTTENFYTPDEVRSMSRSEVRKNYSKIIESMKKWN